MSLVIGLDTSLTGTGIAVLDTQTGWFDLYLIKSAGKKTDTTEDWSDRIDKVAAEIEEALARYEPAAIANIESPSHGSKFGNPHERGGLWWRVVSHLRGRGIRIATTAPTTRAMYGTGNGAAKKPEVYAAVKAQHPDTKFKSDDEADALILAKMAARHLNAPIDNLPEKHTRAMASAKWPA